LAILGVGVALGMPETLSHQLFAASECGKKIVQENAL
jgi:hypothetical protein